MPLIFQENLNEEPVIPQDSGLPNQSEAKGDSRDLGLDTDAPISIYESVKGKTYSQEYFNTDDDMSVVDEYMSKQIEKLGLKDTSDSYKELIQNIMNKLGLSENTDSSVIREKVVKYITLLNKNLSPKEKLKKALKKKDESDKYKESLKKKLQNTLNKKEEEHTEEQKKLENKINKLKQSKENIVKQKEKEFLKKEEEMHNELLKKQEKFKKQLEIQNNKSKKVEYKWNEEIDKVSKSLEDTRKVMELKEKDLQKESQRNMLLEEEIKVLKGKVQGFILEQKNLLTKINNLKKIL